MPGHAAYVGGDGHAVIIQYHDQGLPTGAGVIQALIGQAAGQSAVTHQRKDAVVLSQQGSGAGHTKGYGDGIGGVAGNERVVAALVRLGEAGKAIKLTKGREQISSVGEQLMHVGLVAYIKNQTVFGRVENPVDCNSQFNHA